MEILRRLKASKWRISLIFGIDIICLGLSYQVVLARHGLYSFAFSRNVRSSTVVAMVLCTVAFRLLFRIYHHVWRYATSNVYLSMVLADGFGGIAFYIVDRFILETYLPIVTSVAAIATGLVATLTARFVYSYLRGNLHEAKRQRALLSDPQKHPIRVGIVGAGQLGVLLLNELRMNPASKYQPAYFFDNDPRKIGMTIGGLSVLGPDSTIVSSIHDLPIDELIITLPNLSLQRRQEVFDAYIKTGLKVMVYDYPVERLGDASEKPLIRDIDITDLLFREPVTFSDPDAQVYYHGKVVLVTGAGGSIGSEICRQVTQMSPGHLILLDIYENGVFELNQELLRKYPTAKITIVIANVCESKRMDQVFVDYHPDIVFHAAAHKHVPLMESNCAEAIYNNVFGTLRVVEAAEKAGVSRFVLISTDKAVNPTNIMGATKRMCEMIVQSRQSDTNFVAVRFGNVLGSNGSVVPIFQKQIKEGGPITITHRDINRYFMTIPEAAQLVLRTGRRAESSEIYVLDMGEPIRIYDMARKMISLSGLEPDVDIKIEEVGLRPGEKLYEELLIKPEECQKTEDKRIFIEHTAPPTSVEVQCKLNQLQEALDNETTDEQLRMVMAHCIPTYHPYHSA